MLSLSNKHHIINYHYVEDPREDFSAVHPCTIAEFKRQVKFMSECGRIVGIPEIVKAAQEKNPEVLFAITFDDGLLDQYRFALPVLRQCGATATLFPITKTLDGLMPQTHKIHLLLSRFSALKLIDEVNKIIQELDLPHTSIPKDRRITEKRKLRDDVPTANLKEMFNIFNIDEQDAVLKALFESFKLNEEKLVQEFFMTPDMLEEISDEGFKIGCHTHNHCALDLQPLEVIEEEIRKSKKLLEPLHGKMLTTISYPHGGVNKTVMDVTESLGFKFGTTIELRPITKDVNPLALPRYDTNDLRDAINSAKSD